MQTSSTSTIPAPRAAFSWSGMGIALLAHTGWGAYPVLARYLQTVSDLPSMALLGLGNLIALAVYLPFVWRHVDKRILRSTLIWGFALVVVLRAITNVLAARFTLAIYIQPITLMTPLFVALLSAGLFREPLPPLTWSAIFLSLLGALLMMSGDISAAGVTFALTPSDWIGIALATASALCLAIYMILVPRTVKHAVPGDAVLLMQLVTLTVVSTVVSLLLGEEWMRFTALTLMDWMVFAAFVFGVLLGANLGQIVSLRRLGAPLVSSVMAWRLIATLALAALLLSERLDSWWQIVGAVMVLITITGYLWRQGRLGVRG
ncbi:MAG: DMT family transporter [Roseiflexaceae bacterium]|nr:DMT family transporter [Roseiflexaceae bacterium]